MGGCLLLTPYWGPGPQLRHALETGNQTSDPLVRRVALSPQSHSSQGTVDVLLLSWKQMYLPFQRHADRHIASRKISTMLRLVPLLMLVSFIWSFETKPGFQKKTPAAGGSRTGPRATTVISMTHQHKLLGAEKASLLQVSGKLGLIPSKCIVDAIQFYHN